MSKQLGTSGQAREEDAASVYGCIGTPRANMQGGSIGRYLCCHHVTPRLLNKASPVFSGPWNSTKMRESLEMSEATRVSRASDTAQGTGVIENEISTERRAFARVCVNAHEGARTGYLIADRPPTHFMSIYPQPRVRPTFGSSSI